MVKKLKLNLLRNVFKKEGLYLFTPFDIQKYFGVSPNAVNLFLYRNVKNGYILKIRNNLYKFSDEYVNEMLIANKIYQPSYISFEYALNFYGIIPETVYKITSATTRTTREFVVQKLSYVYHHLKKEVFTGYIKKSFREQTILIAEPEKALADYLYFVNLGKKPLGSRLNLKEINREKLIKYLYLFKRKDLLNLVKQIYD